MFLKEYYNKNPLNKGISDLQIKSQLINAK